MSQPTYTLHTSPDSASMIVSMALRLTGARFAEVTIDRAAGELDSPAYRAMQPLGKIPALQTPDGAMFETAAMLLYLGDRHGLIPASTSAARAAFLKWLFFTSTNLHPTLLQVFYPDRIAGKPCAEAVAAQAAATLKDQFAIFNAMVARDQPDWFGPTSLLTYYIGTLLRWLAGFPTDTPAHITSADYPAIHAVLLAAETTPAALALAEAESLGPTIFTHPAY